MQIISDDKIPFLKGVLDAHARVFYLPGSSIKRSELIDADVLITRSITICNEELLRNTNVSVIATATIGTDHIDLDYCAKSGIKVISAKGCNAAAVEQYVTTALLYISETNKFLFSKKTLGIIGVGAVGSKVQRVAEALGMSVLLNDPPRQEMEGNVGFVSIEKIQKKADIISLHVPLSTKGKYPTYHLANTKFFDGFRKPLIFINTSRGSVVDTLALKNAIKRGKVLSSVLDVFENEPEIDLELLNLLMLSTPHIAGYSHQGKAMGTAMVVQALSKMFNWNMDHWFPEIEKGKVIKFDCAGLYDIEVLQQIYKLIYPIGGDDHNFRKMPEKFEQLRRNYNFRNDNESITLNLKNAGNSLISKLKKLNFKLEFYQ